ncbi:MAG: TolC family protein [Cellulosilyticaceae bacterium]
MSSKKLAIYMLSAAMLMQAATPNVYGATKEPKVLTLEKAIKSAQDTSTQLRLQERNTELAKENADMAKLLYGYYAYDEANIQPKYMEKQQSMMKDNIELSMMELFDSILATEAQVKNLETNIELQEKQIQKAKIEEANGIQSTLYVEEILLRLEQSKGEKEKLIKDIDQMYTQLCNMIGTSKQMYILEKPELTFEPYRKVMNVDSFAKSKAEDHIDLWKANEELRVAQDTPIYTQDYMQYITKKAERENKKDQVELTQDQLEKRIKDTYLTMKKLEADYTLKEQQLVLEEKQQQVNALYYEKGMMSQLDYDMSVLKYEMLKLEIAGMINQHSYLKFRIDHPHLL